MSQGTDQAGPRYRNWLRGALVFLALLVIARFVLEVAGVPGAITRYLSSSAAVFLAAIYLGAVAPLRGVKKFVQLIVPAIVVAAWTVAWVILATLVSGVLRLERSHFAEKDDYGNWARLGHHIFEHVVEIGIFAVLVLILMAVPYFLHRWPVTVGPAALLGALVIIRYWAEAMGAAPANAAAWSSTVAVLIAGFYIGGVGPRLASSAGKHPFLYGLVIGWVWRFWVFLATLLSAIFPFYKTHFFDPSSGHVASRLLQFFAFGFIVEGLIAGLVVGIIGEWIMRATWPGRQEKA